MSITLCLAGDTMLGRGVAKVLSQEGPPKVVSEEVMELTREADLFLLNLECCISTRGEPWAAAGKPFFFRAPPVAIDVLVDLGVDCVTLANNHALDFGYDALIDTLDCLNRAGISHVGAGEDIISARRSQVLTTKGFSIEVIGFSDHPADFAATSDRPGIAHADLRNAGPDWVLDTARTGGGDALFVTAHWGPNMTSEPLPYVEAAAEALVANGATLVAGHSAHVFHGVRGPVLFDLGDFIDDYATDPILRNDLGLLWFVTFDRSRPTRLEAVPLKLDYCNTVLARDEDAAWIEHRFRESCAAMGTEVFGGSGRLKVVLEN
jgi:poly-gamma-glutamate capsule biosynthesis protein CapA/YwtB (metallophosphatase superfamily)